MCVARRLPTTNERSFPHLSGISVKTHVPRRKVVRTIEHGENLARPHRRARAHARTRRSTNFLGGMALEVFNSAAFLLVVSYTTVVLTFLVDPCPSACGFFWGTFSLVSAPSCIYARFLHERTDDAKPSSTGWTSPSALLHLVRTHPVSMREHHVLELGPRGE